MTFQFTLALGHSEVLSALLYAYPKFMCLLCWFLTRLVVTAPHCISEESHRRVATGGLYPLNALEENINYLAKLNFVFMEFDGFPHTRKNFALLKT